MIADYRQNLGRYKGISPALDLALDYLMSPEADKLEGKIELDGTKVYVNSQTPELKSLEDTKWEVHQRYMDIHMGMEDGEILGYLYNSTGLDLYEKRADCLVSDTVVPCDTVKVGKDMCVLLWPDEPHKPNTGVGKTRKLVAKILINE